MMLKPDERGWGDSHSPVALAANRMKVASFQFMMSIARRILQFPTAIVMASYYALTAIVGPIVRPIGRGLAKLRIAQALRSAIMRLGPYSSLSLLIVPIIIIEPLKIGSLAILASGRILLGATALAISHGLSLIVIERLFAVVKPKLLTLPWFAAIWGWFTAMRDRMLGWLHSTWAWSIVIRVRDATRAIVASIFQLQRRP